MSYILDALKRADAERERGTIPGIHAQPAVDWPGQAAHPTSAGRTLWFVLGVATVLSGSIAWRIWGNQSSHPVAANGSTTAAPASSPGVPPNQVQAQPKAVITQAPDVDVTPRSPISTRPEPVAVRHKPTPPAMAINSQATPPLAQLRTSPQKATVGDKVIPLSELPDEIRRELPVLSISGAIYSENVANRFLIVNGQIFHESETPVPGVVLERIKLKSAVLSFKGYRYSVTY